MKLPQSHLEDTEAKAQLNKYLLIGYCAYAVGYTVFGWALLVAFLAAGRSTVLSFHKANAQGGRGDLLQVASIALVVLSLADIKSLFQH